ncbi:MAG: GNAT family N-acetyltransferase [Cyclobacteriaceae bacterium]
MEFEVSHDEKEQKGRFFIQNKSSDIAEMTYSVAGDDKIIIDHTQVDESYRGKDLGKKLVFKAAEFARNKGIKVVPLCPFANAIFKKNQELQDVLSK